MKSDDVLLDTHELFGFDQLARLGGSSGVSRLLAKISSSEQPPPPARLLSKIGNEEQPASKVSRLLAKISNAEDPVPG